MSLYHFSVDLVSRADGRSAVACAAYRSGERLYDSYYNETQDYTRKGGVMHTEIILPDHVPKRLSDREVLWNEVESVEKHPKAQLAYSFNIALQNELSYEENLELARKFVIENFISRGMIADLAVHDPDKDDNGIRNPHFHVLCPVRPIDPDGTWGAKQHRQYILDQNGERIKNEDGSYKFNAVPTTDWGSPQTLLLWRENWAAIVNRKFEEKGIQTRIDHRSFVDQGLDLIPTVHEGPTVRAMEAKGICTDKGDLNRMIKKTNQMIEKLVEHIKDLADWISALIEVIREDREAEKFKELERKTLYDVLTEYYDERDSKAYSTKAKINNMQKRYDMMNFLSENHIRNLDDLSKKVSDMYSDASDACSKLKSCEAEIADINRTIDLLNKYEENRPYYNALNVIKNTSASDSFKEENRSHLSLYHMARRELKKMYPDALPDRKELKERLKVLDGEHAGLLDRYKKLKAEANTAYSFKKAIEADYKKAMNEPEKNRERREL